MADTTASLKLGLVDDGFVKGVTDASTQLTNLQIAATATGVALPLVEKGMRSFISSFALGTKNADDYARNLRKVISLNTELTTVIGKASNIAFYAQQFATLAKGASEAYASLKRIPETLEQMQRSGVSTESISGFMSLRDAISGSQSAVESFAQVAVSKLNEVESASARVGTILRSSTEFTEAGTAKRANATDLTKNRKSIQELLRNKLDNSVTTRQALLGQYEVLSGGFTSEKSSQQVLEAGGKLIGIAGAGGQVVDPTATLQLLTKTLRAYGLEASQATRVSAILNSTVENGITTIQELSQTFGQASQVAKTAGISIEDLAAATSILTAQGTSTPVALTGIQALSRSIIDKTPEAAKELAKLRDKEGNRIRFDIREVQQKGLAKSVQDIFEATGGNQEKLAQILPDTLAYRTALGLNSNKGQDFANVTNSIKSNANAKSLDEVFKGATDDRINRFQKIANRFEETIIQLGESLAPIFEPGLAYLEKASKMIANIPEPIKKAIGAYLAFKIQAKSVGIAFGQMGGAIVSVVANLAILRVISLALSGQLGKQVAIIKDLILQQRGYRSVIKQMIGIDQSHLLLTEQTTEAIGKQGVVQKTVNAAKEKANNIIKKNIEGFTSQSSAVSHTTQAVGGLKSRFLEFTEAIRKTTVGQKFEEITAKVTGQTEALKKLGEAANSALGKTKEVVGEGVKKVTGPQKSEMDKQVEIYAAKRRAEIEKNIPDSPGSFGGLLDIDPEAQRDTRRREVLAERDRRRVARQQKKLQQQAIQKQQADAQSLIDLQSERLLASIGSGTFGDSLDVIDNASFGDFAEKEQASTEAQRKKVLADIKSRRQDREKQNTPGGSFGDFLGIPGVPSGVTPEIPGDSFGTFMAANPDVDDTPQRPTRESLRERSRSRGFTNLNDSRRVIEARRLSGIDDKLSVWQAVGYLGEKSFKGVGAVAKESFSLITEFSGIALAALGPIVPIGLAIGAAFAVAGKELTHLFGGGASNALSKSIAETTKALKELEKESGKDGALLGFKTTLGNLAESNEIKADGLKPLESRLTQLRDAGNLTEGQFTAMGNAMRKAGEDGKVTAQELSILQNKIESFRAGAPGEVEKGVLDNFKEVFSLKGLGKGINAYTNTALALSKNFLSPQNMIKGEFATTQSINADREGDRLIKPLSELRTQILDPAGESVIRSAEQTKKLTGGIFLTEEARKEAAKGSQIQGAVLEKENKETTELIKKNEILISGFQNQAKARADLLEETTDEGLKQQLIDQFEAAQSQIDNLQKRTEALKQAREQITKYYNETLPVLQQAVVSSSVNPLEANGALDDAFAVFKEKYIDEGKVFLKDVQQQRTEGQAVLDQILQNYDRNLLKSGEVAGKVKEVLDKSFISLTKDGKTIKGSVFDIDTQKNLISQIAQFNSQATSERLALIDIESSAMVAAGQQRKASEVDVIKTISGLQQEKLGLQKQQLEQEILLRMQYGIKTTDLENQLKQVSLDIAQSEFNEREKLIQKQLDQKIQAIDTEKSLISAQISERGLSEENAQKKLAQLQIDESNLKASELKRQLDEYAANGVKSVELENQYAQARNQIRELEAKEKERLIQLDLRQRIQALDIEKNQAQVLGDEGKLGQETISEQTANLSIEQAKLKEQDLKRQVDQLKANGQKSVSLEQEYAQQRLEVRSLEAREKKRLIEQELSQKIRALDIEQAEIEAKVSERTISEKDAQTAITQSRIQQEKLKLADIDRQVKLLKDNNGSSKALDQEASSARIRIRKMEADERNRLEDLAIDTQKKQIENENQRASLRRQALESEYDLLQKQAQIVESITNSRNQLADTESRYVQSQLQNQARLTRDPLKQAEIELRIIGERKADLERTQKSELQSLATRQQLAKIDLQRQKSQIESQQLELEGQAQVLAIELKRAITQKRSPEEIEAIRLQIQSNEQRTKSLGQQSTLIDKQINQQGEINQNEKKRVTLTQQIESENLRIETRLAKQKVIQEQIDKVAKAFVLEQQKLQAQYEKQTSALEKQNTIVGFQKQLIEAKQKAFNDALNFRTSELNVASQLITNDKQRQVLAQATATMKLKALDEQQKAEREVLALNQQQAKVQAQIDAIKLKSQQSQNKADVAQAEADLAKLKASGATSEEITAGEMNLQAKQQAGQSLELQAKLLPLQSQLNDYALEQESKNLDNKQKLDRLQAKSELASTLPEGSQQAQLKQQIINESLSDVYGKKVTNWNYRSVIDQIAQGNQADLRQVMGGKPSATEGMYRSGMSRIDYGPTPKVQGLTVPSGLEDIQKKLAALTVGEPTAPNASIGQTEYTRFQQNAQNVENNVKMEIGGIKITVTSPGDIGKDIEQEVLKAFDNIMIETKRRL